MREPRDSFIDEGEVRRVPTEGAVRAGNEFAQVDVWPVVVPGGSLLMVHDVKRGTAILLDALELEALTRLSHEDFAVLVDPSFAGLPPAPADVAGTPAFRRPRTP